MNYVSTYKINSNSLFNIENAIRYKTGLGLPATDYTHTLYTDYSINSLYNFQDLSKLIYLNQHPFLKYSSDIKIHGGSVTDGIPYYCANYYYSYINGFMNYQETFNHIRNGAPYYELNEFGTPLVLACVNTTSNSLYLYNYSPYPIVIDKDWTNRTGYSINSSINSQFIYV